MVSVEDVAFLDPDNAHRGQGPLAALPRDCDVRRVHQRRGRKRCRRRRRNEATVSAPSDDVDAHDVGADPGLRACPDALSQVERDRIVALTPLVREQNKVDRLVEYAASQRRRNARGQPCGLHMSSDRGFNHSEETFKVVDVIDRSRCRLGEHFLGFPPELESMQALYACITRDLTICPDRKRRHGRNSSLPAYPLDTILYMIDSTKIRDYDHFFELYLENPAKHVTTSFRKFFLPESRTSQVPIAPSTSPPTSLSGHLAARTEPDPSGGQLLDYPPSLPPCSSTLDDADPV